MISLCTCSNNQKSLLQSITYMREHAKEIRPQRECGLNKRKARAPIRFIVITGTVIAQPKTRNLTCVGCVLCSSQRKWRLCWLGSVMENHCDFLSWNWRTIRAPRALEYYCRLPPTRLGRITRRRRNNRLCLALKNESWLSSRQRSRQLPLLTVLAE